MDNNDIFVTGIGSSAGGLEALSGFVKNIRDCKKTAYVIVQHLKSDYRSMLAEILSRNSTVPVKEITDGMKVEASTVYVMPAGYKLKIEENRLTLHERPKDEIINKAIDYFFISLAHTKHSRSFGVILSGTGTDGVEGVKEIEKMGGVVLVQDPDTARFDGMPENTIHLDHPDFVLPPEQMPGLIQELQERGKYSQETLRKY